jgi:hypothetical protein
MMQGPRRFPPRASGHSPVPGPAFTTRIVPPPAAPRRNAAATAYFLDPNFYDSEFAEGRVRTLAFNRAQRRFALDHNAGMSDAEILNSSDTVAAGLAMGELAKKSWDDKTRDSLVALLSRDYPSLRYGAADILGKHADASFDAHLQMLLKSGDLRVRAAAAYIAEARWKSAVTPILESWLADPVDLIRYDGDSTGG